MAAADITGFQPESLCEMTAGEIVVWIEAKLESSELIDSLFDLDEG